MRQPTLFDDPCQNRHGGNAESVDAFARIAPTLPEARSQVLECIRWAGERGATVKEIGEIMGKPPNAISGRLTELCAAKLIRRKGVRREHASVWILTGRTS